MTPEKLWEMRWEAPVWVQLGCGSTDIWTLVPLQLNWHVPLWHHVPGGGTCWGWQGEDSPWAVSPFWAYGGKMVGLPWWQLGWGFWLGVGVGGMFEMTSLSLRSPGRSSGWPPQVGEFGSGTWERSCSWRWKSGSCSRHNRCPQLYPWGFTFVKLAGLNSNSPRALLLAGTCPVWRLLARSAWELTLSRNNLQLMTEGSWPISGPGLLAPQMG